MISVEGLRVEFGGFTLFDDVSFVVNKKDRIALVGKNGAGKSTMLKIFAGLQSPTAGTVSVPKETTIGYLPQHMQLQDERTVRQEAELAFEHIHEMSDEKILNWFATKIKQLVKAEETSNYGTNWWNENPERELGYLGYDSVVKVQDCKNLYKILKGGY